MQNQYESPARQQRQENGKSASGTDHAQLVCWFEDAEEASCEARKLAERDRDYVDGKQLTAEQLAELRKRGQPDIIINRIKTKVNFLVGMETQSRTDPKAFPRNPQDEQAAEAATDALRYVEEKEDIDTLATEVWSEMVVEGFSGAEVLHRETKRGIEIDVKHWSYHKLFYDPHSSRHDFSDARYKGGVIWMDFDVAAKRWPRHKDILTATVTAAGSGSYDDRPTWRKWATGGKRKRVRIVQMYYLDGAQWKWSVFTEAGELEGGDVPYRDSEGESECPLILQSAYIDREHNRYGEVRAMISPQDEINARRSALLHAINVRQMLYEDGAIDDVDEARAQLARRDGAIKINGREMRFEVRDNTVQMQGHAELLQEAKSEIDNLTANNALQGRTGSSSGRAIIASQQGGLIEISPLTDRHRHFKRSLFRAIWSRIQQFWDEEKWVRVTDNEENVKFVGLNRTITVAEQIIEDAVKQGYSKQEAMQFVQEQMQNPVVAEQLQQTSRVNVPAEMDMDIIVEVMPDSISVQHEQFELLTNMVQAGLPIPPEVIIRASQLRDKGKLLDMMKPQQQEPDPVQQQALQLQMANAEADLHGKYAKTEETRTKAIKNLADAEKSDAEQLLKEQEAVQNLPLSQFGVRGF